MDYLPRRGMALLVLLLVLVPAAEAATSTTFQVSATIQAGCQVNNAAAPTSVGTLGTLNFGTQSALSTATLSTSLTPNASITLACTPGVTLNMQVDSGQSYASGRRLKRTSNSQTVAYQLFSNAALSNAIPVNTATAINYSNSAAIQLPIYGSVQLPGNLPAGTYQDQVVVTLQW
ncbi:spore coat protein U-like protein [Silvimonas terrae]|uniref:Spore coat protein U-like protein n=1 Tax=Silvimonas terrae TaxID=300266 RepID=A0A840RL04_9NEIS|nr:spore coat U domain-containing protein [Silvimonas terrae]MBB5193198.1 spore coat protein U-like protein [Silvimonas terrae]